jgi:hypothetical protein
MLRFSGLPGINLATLAGVEQAGSNASSADIPHGTLNLSSGNGETCSKFQPFSMLELGKLVQCRM